MMRFDILVVDDNRLQGTTRKAILTGGGWQTAVTQDPKEAMGMLARPEVRSALRVLITDHVMPSMQGPELVRQVREILPELPVLVISGDPEAEPAYSELNVLFLLKPVQPDLLLETVRSIMPAAEVARTA